MANTKWRLTVKAPCTMLVEVEGKTEAEALEAARRLEWEPVGDWQADYEKVTIPRGSKPKLLLDDEAVV